MQLDIVKTNAILKFVSMGLFETHGTSAKRLALEYVPFMFSPPLYGRCS